MYDVVFGLVYRMFIQNIPSFSLISKNMVIVYSDHKEKTYGGEQTKKILNIHQIPVFI